MTKRILGIVLSVVVICLGVFFLVKPVDARSRPPRREEPDRREEPTRRIQPTSLRVEPTPRPRP